MQPLVRIGLIALGIAVGYFVAVFVGAVLSVPADGFAIIWPVRAFLISALMLLPIRRWWCVAAVVPTHFLMAAAFMPGSQLGLVTLQIVSHLGVALLTAFAVRRLNPPDAPFCGVSALFKFVLVAGVVVPGVVDGAILAVKDAAGWSDGLSHVWWQWMVAGFFPTITIPPLLVLGLQGGLVNRPGAAASQRRELALVVPALFAVSLLAFGGVVDAEQWPAIYLAPLPLLLWATARLGVGGTSLALLTMAGGIAIQALRQTGPFTTDTLVQEVESLQVYLDAVSAPLLLFAALMDERHRTANLLRQFEAGMQVAASQTDTGLWLWDTVEPRLLLTANCRAMFGMRDEETNTPLDFLDAVHPEDKAMVGEAIGKALADGEQMPVLEFRLCSGDRTRWFVLQSRTACDEDGKPISVSGVFRDISERIEARLAVERLEERLATLQDDERRRIAQELHDLTAQHLVAAALNLVNLRKRVPEELQRLLDDASRSLREATSEIRTFTYLLHGSQLDEEGLHAMLRRYAPGFARRTGIVTSLRVNSRADDLPGELQHALLRLTQECLGNMQRHAGATRASIDLRCVGETMHLVVRDNGKGIGRDEGEQLAERLRLGRGISSMTVRVRPSRSPCSPDCNDRGTTIYVALPLDIAIPSGVRGIASIARETLGAGLG